LAVKYNNMDNKQHILSVVKKKIREIDPGAKIILFGSRARGNFSKDSDWDFLILTKMSVTQELKNRICDTLFEAELETEEVLTGIIQNKVEWENYSQTPIYRYISAEGVVI
jgi:predicted nucleotidyltransferase